jgi:hypothetical protein
MGRRDYKHQAQHMGNTHSDTSSGMQAGTLLLQDDGSVNLQLYDCCSDKGQRDCHEAELCSAGRLYDQLLCCASEFTGLFA